MSLFPHRLALLLPVLLLAACSAPKPLPDFRYYTPPQLAAPDAAERAGMAFSVPVVVDWLRAAGVRGERPILYTSAADPVKLLQYHYQLWTEPPTTLVQEFLIRRLEGSGLSTMVTDQLALREPSVRISGQINRFERSRHVPGSTWAAVVELRLRAVLLPSGKALLDQRYLAQVAAADDKLESSVRAFGTALEQIGTQLIADLQAAAIATPDEPIAVPAGSP